MSGFSIAALSLGMAIGAYDAALKYSKQRKQFGKAISEFQAIQWKLADMATEIEAAKLLTLRAGAGGRAGMLAQTIEYTGPNPQLVLLQNESQTAFVFGPEALVAARIALGQSFFVDLGGTGSVMFLRESGSLRGITGAVAALTLGARF